MADSHPILIAIIMNNACGLKCFLISHSRSEMTGIWDLDNEFVVASFMRLGLKKILQSPIPPDVGINKSGNYIINAKRSGKS